MIAPLLPKDALVGKRLGISASESVDLPRLGLTNKHLHLALGELARTVLVGGGTLAWGGHLKPDGLTPFLIDEVDRYGRKDGDPLLVCLAWSVHRGTSLDDLDMTAETLGLHGRLVCLDLHGNEIDPCADRDREPVAVATADEVQGLTAMRRYLCAHTHGRLMIGGQRSRFNGRMPGLIEEALLTLEADQPLYLAGGFGGATADIARAAGHDMEWLPELRDDPPPGIAHSEGLARVQEVLKTHPLRTGLEKDDQDLLSCTHRPSEVATLVSRGLGSVFGGQ